MTDGESELKTMRLVNAFLTPFAALLVVSGVMVAPFGRDSAAALAILAATATMNMATLKVAGRRPDLLAKVRNLRITLNHFLNVWLIWLLLPHWPPVWMLFLLTMIAVGAYEGWKETLSHAILLGGLLLVVAYFRGVAGTAAWTELGVRCATLACVGLFTNRLRAQ